MNVQSCFMSTFISINIARLFRPSKPQKCQNHNFDKIMHKKEIIFVYLPNTIAFYAFSNQFAKRKETFIIKLINTGGTSGQNFTRLRR